MNTEEKAKAYDEALGRARNEYQTHKSFNGFRGMLVRIFPELQEDKDEMIKNFICNELACLRATDEKGSDRYNELTEAIGWIEKQGKKESQSKSALEVWKDMRFEIYQQASGDEITRMFSLIEIDEIIEKIAKTQDEYTNPCHTCDHPVLSCNNFPCEKKQGRQKHANKVESKFHEGDWIISNTANEDYRICKITDINNGNYTIESIYGYKGYNNFNVFEESYRLWTIQDARNGDVLASNKSIFIFREEYIGGKPTAHYGLMNGLFIEGNGACWTNEKCYPATKEQRDLLFQKMKEAGYLWNFEKKELEKIEQKLDEWIEEYWQHHKVVNPDSYDKGEEIQFDHQGFVRFCKKYCKNHAEWSEEDKGNLLDVKCVIDEVWHNQKIDYSGKELESLWHWLDSIWQRVEYPQDYWKPGKDQMKWLKDVIETVPMNCRQQIPLESLYNDLQKLL